MAKGCRDCPRCTESAATSMVLAIFRLIIWLFWGLWVGLFQKKCPQCGHLLSIHQRVNGRFVD
jgi:hypothetical protein